MEKDKNIKNPKGSKNAPGGRKAKEKKLIKRKSADDDKQRPLVSY